MQQRFLDTVIASGVHLAPKSSIPLFYQLYVVLQRSIRELRMDAGDRFPSEAAIARAFSVSRPTASRAVQKLLSQGWLSRKRGRGTFVARSSSTQLALLNTRLSFSEEMAAHGDYSVRIITKQVTAATRADVEALSASASTPIVWLRRVHTVEGNPVMVCDSRLSAERFPGLEKTPLAEGSLYRTLEESYGCRVRRAERCVEAAGLLDGHVSELLGVPLFAPILFLSGLAYTADGDIVQHMIAYVREGVSFKNVIMPDHVLNPVRDEACPRGRLLPDQSRLP